MPDFTRAPRSTRSGGSISPTRLLAERRARFRSPARADCRGRNAEGQRPRIAAGARSARRARAFVGEFTGGSFQHAAVLKTMFEGLPLAESAAHMPDLPAVWDFMQ